MGPSTEQTEPTKGISAGRPTGLSPQSFPGSSSGRLKLWQWGVLALPIVGIVGFLLIAAGLQIHAWGISWIWAIITLMFVGWRWLLVRWTQPWLKQMSGAIADLQDELDSSIMDGTDFAARASIDDEVLQKADAAVRDIIAAAEDDLPIWEDWPTFWQRCQQVVGAIAHLYHPEVKYPLLNIHIPQAYGLIRGTVDDMDQWMEKLSPVLNQVSVGQAYQAYEVYRKLEPSARKLMRVWNWAQWVWNPAAAAARTVSQPYNNQATQQLLVNLSQSLREVGLRTLSQQAIALYSGKSNPPSTLKAEGKRQKAEIKAEGKRQKAKVQPLNSKLPTAPPPQPPNPPTPQLPNSSSPQTQTLRRLLEQADPPAAVDQKPVNILLVGRTGSGKSSVINTLFQTEQAAVDVLPSTDQIQEYQWHQAATNDRLVLWDTPGYEQSHHADFRDRVLDHAQQADLILLVTPALDPALQMDLDFLAEVKAQLPDLPTFVAVTQVDRLRPMREWSPPYDWQWGSEAKEQSIRHAVEYRVESLDTVVDQVLPLVTMDRQTDRTAWNAGVLAETMMGAIAPAKQLRLARFLRSQDAQANAAARIINDYTLQMTTTQGMTALLKSPVLKFISTLTTGSPDLAYLLEEQIPVEQLPLVIGKLQMAYDLFNLFISESPRHSDWGAEPTSQRHAFNLLSLWPLLLENDGGPKDNAQAFGHAMVEYWTQPAKSDEAIAQLTTRFHQYLEG